MFKDKPIQLEGLNELDPDTVQYAIGYAVNSIRIHNRKVNDTSRGKLVFKFSDLPSHQGWWQTTGDMLRERKLGFQNTFKLNKELYRLVEKELG